MTAEPVAVMDTLDWDLFLERYWDRQAVLITDVPEPPFEADEIFQAAVAGSRPPSPGVMPPNVQFSIGRDLQIEPGPWLPKQPDGSLVGYDKRLAEQLDGRRYNLTLHVLHAFHRPQWRRERDFYAALWERIGLPLTGAITTLFHGNYEHSPVGVHLDRFSTFMYALSGRKRMRFWTDRPWSYPVTSMLDYEPYLDSSFTAEVEPGQLLYWPSTYYHVGESDLSEQAATSVNIGVPRSGHRARFDLENLLFDTTPESMMPGSPESAQLVDGARAAADPGGLLMPPDRAGAELDDRLPPAVEYTVECFGEVATRERVADRVAVLSLRRWTAGGLEPAPAPAAPRPLTGADTVSAVEPILWRAGATEGAATMCAAAGHVTRTALPTDRLADLVAQLRSGVPVPVADVAEDGRTLLETLESFGALVRNRRE